MTLVEAVVATSFCALVLIGVVMAAVTAGSMNYAAAQRLSAFGLCRERLEQMRAYTNFAAISDATFLADAVQVTHVGGSPGVPLMGVRSCVISNITVKPERKLAAVTVGWTFRGRPYQENVSGVIYKKTR